MYAIDILIFKNSQKCQEKYILAPPKHRYLKERF
jgi:hypothetical protein